MTTKQERIKIIKMLEQLNEAPLIRFHSSDETYESVINDEDSMYWSFNFGRYFSIIDAPSSDNIYIVSDTTWYMGGIIFDKGLDYLPLDSPTGEVIDWGRIIGMKLMIKT